MTEKVDWDNLPTAIDTWIRSTKNLSKGLYGCPRCEATGRIQVGHADPGPNPTVNCGMCNGTRVIKRCGKCQENPVPSDSVLGLCNECEEHLMKDILELEKRVGIVCSFPEEKGICAHSEFQKCNSKGKLVCDPDSCEYANIPLTVYPEECIVRQTNGEEYCETCVDKEICPWKKQNVVEQK